LRRKLITGALVTLFVLGALATRVVWEGRAALADGDAAIARGDAAGAVEHWGRAARWYAPLAPHVADAYDRLERVATDAERRGDLDLSLAAWRAVRGAALATRSLHEPHADRRARADARIAVLMATAPGEGAAWRRAPGAGDTAGARAAFYGRQLADDGAPSRGWTLVALAGLALWLGGAVHFARRGLDDADRLVRRAAGTAGGLIGVGVLAWVIGLYNA
jgi:hypothetical protein